MLRNRWVKALLFVLCLLPLASLAWRAWQGDLSANPIEFVTHFTGDWTIRFIVLTLAVTPLRRLLRLPDLIRFRRLLGLYAFFYGALHFLTWLWLDKFFDIHEIAQDVVKRSFITAGFLSLLLMLPLAITSTNGWIKRLGAKRWQLLHRAVYLAAIAGAVHYYWLVKSDIRLPALYGVLLGLLLGFRLLGARSSPANNALALKLSGIQRQTTDTVTLRFPLPGGKPLGAKPGQFLTFDWLVDGRKLPRSYSISSSPRRTDYVEITVKQQGVVSTFLNQSAKPGLTVQAHGPYGQFCFDESRHRSVVLFAGGSGITPIVSMLRHIEEAAPETSVTLFYAVRTPGDVIFQEELQRLQTRLPHFHCLILPSRPGPEGSGPRVHLTREIVEPELARISDLTFFVCGPAGFMASVEALLTSLGARASQILRERFTLGTPTPAPLDVTTWPVEFVKSGQTHPCSADDTLLALAENHGIDIPSSCRVGQCGTCATRALAGDVEMEVDDGLPPAQRAQGYRLMCVGRARGPVKLDA